MLQLQTVFQVSNPQILASSTTQHYSRVSNPRILEVQTVSRVFNPEVSRVLVPEILGVQAVSRVLDPEILEEQAVSRVVLDPKILPVQAESEAPNLRTARMPSSNTIYVPGSFEAWGSCRVAITTSITCTRR